MLKRILLITGLFMVIFGTSCFAMTDQEIQQAIQVGYKVADNKHEFVYNEMDTDKVRGGGFLGAEIRLMGRAYSQSPFSVIATKALNTKKNYYNLDDKDVKSLSDIFAVRVILVVADANAKTLEITRIVGLQDNKIIEPTKIETKDPQFITDRGLFGSSISMNVGTTVSFKSSDIDITKPLRIKVITPLCKELTFKFTPQNYGTTYKEANDNFKF